MPYRRLPTTDKARLRALNTALTLASKREQKKLLFSRGTLEELSQIRTGFVNILTQYKQSLKKLKEHQTVTRGLFVKSKLYLSHFIQVIYMTIEREEMKKEALVFYGLNETDRKIPALNTEEELLHWGKKIIDGDQTRIRKGGNAIYNPSIAMVKIHFEAFYDAMIFHQNLKRNHTRFADKIAESRKSVNDFISRLWTEIEENVQTGLPKHKRQVAAEYGVVYIFRRRERKKLNPDDLQADLLFDFN